MDAATEQAWIRFLQDHGLATFEQIEAAQRIQAKEPGISLPEILVRQNVITVAQYDNIFKKVAAQQKGLTQLGSFKLQRKLGEGGMGAVYLAEDTLAGRTVAIKVLPKKYSDSPEFIARFRREARATGKLNHPNIVAAYNFGEEGGSHYFVMEYMSGAPLDARLRDGARVPWDEAIRIVRQIAEGLKYAHDHGLIHRDIKPANIFITDDGVAKILDLGLSKSIDENDQSFMTQSGAVLGTPHYISPEQARSDKGIDGRTDIYSLGATLYHLVTGRTPFEGSGAAVILMKHLTEQLPNPLDFNPDLPEPVVDVIRRMMAKHPMDRYNDCDELLADLVNLEQGRPPSSPRLDEEKSSVMLRREHLSDALHSAGRRLVSHDAGTPLPESPAPSKTAPKKPSQKSTPLVLYIAGAALAAVVLGVVIVVMRTPENKLATAPKESPKPEPEPRKPENVVAKDPPKEPAKEPPRQPAPSQPIQPPAQWKQNPPPRITREAPSAPEVSWNRAVDLIPLSVAADAVNGEWELADNRLTSPRSPMNEKVRFAFPYEPPRDFDLRADLEILPGERESDLSLIFPRHGAVASFKLLNLESVAYTGFGNVAGMNILAPDNRTTHQMPPLQPSRRYVVLLEVRPEGLRAYVNGERVSEWRSEMGELSLWDGLRLRGDRVLGLGTASNRVAFHRVQVREVSGPGRNLRGPTRIDLLSLIDPARDTVRGTWQRRDDGALVSDATGDFTAGVGGARVEIPYRPPLEYDLRIEFMRLSGQQCVAALFPSPAGAEGFRGTYAFIAGGWSNTLAGFEMVNNQGAHGPQNITARRGSWLRTGQRQTLLLQVRRNGARAMLDGVEVSFTRPNYANMSPPHWYALRDPALLGLASWASPMAFFSADLFPLGGTGTPTREPGAR